MEGGVTQFCLTISQLVRVAARNMYFSILKWSRFIKSDSGSVGNQSGRSFSASNVVHLQEKEFQLVRKKSFQTQKAFIKGSNRGLREGFNQTQITKKSFCSFSCAHNFVCNFGRISIGLFQSKLKRYSSASKYTPFIPPRLTCRCLFHL